MHRIDGDYATIDNKFTEGDPGAGVRPTRITDDWLNDVQENLAKAVESVGLALVKGDYDQLVAVVNFLRNAGNLNAGTIPDARFPATLPALNGAALTDLNADNLASGTIPSARFPATLPALNGSALTNLNASNLASGSIPAARMGDVVSFDTTAAGGSNKTLAAMDVRELRILNFSWIPGGTAKNLVLPSGGTYYVLQPSPTTSQSTSVSSNGKIFSGGSVIATTGASDMWYIVGAVWRIA